MTKELRNKLLSQVVLAFSQGIFPLLTYPIITRALRADGLGKVAFTDSLAQFLVMVAGLGIPLYGIREIAVHRNRRPERSRNFWELFLIQLIFSLPACVLMWTIGAYSQIDQRLVTLAIFNILFSCLTCEWYLTGMQQFLYVALRSFFIRLSATLLIFFLVKDSSDYVLYYGILVGSVVLTMVLNMVSVSRSVSWSFGDLHLGAHLKKMNWVYGCYLLISVYTLLDAVILGWLASDTAVGLYTLGYKMVRLGTMFIISLGAVFIPRIAFFHAEKDRAALEEQVRISRQLMLFFSIPLSAVCLVLAPQIVDVFADDRFSSSVWVLRIISPIPFFITLSHLAGIQVMLPMRQEKRYFFILLGGSLLNITVNLLLIPRYGEHGSAIASLLTESLIAIACTRALGRYGLHRFPWKEMVKFLLSAALLMPVVWLWNKAGLDSGGLLVASLITFGALYLAIHLLVMPDRVLRGMFFLRKVQPSATVQETEAQPENKV